MAKDINLLSYWMRDLRQLKEFKEIANAEEPELRYILEAIDRTLNNMFIETADEYGIGRFESMMGIYPNEGDTLDTRKFNVFVKWNDKVPYTEKELYNKLLSICGSEDLFEIVEKYKDYEIDISTHLGVAGAFDTIATMLQDMLPCNMILELKNTIEANKTTPLGVGVVTCTAMVYQITNDINCEYVGSGSMYYGIGVGEAGIQLITNDISGVVNKTSDLNSSLAGATGATHIITMDVALEDDADVPLNEGMCVGMAQTHIITNDVSSEANVTGNSTVASPVNTATVITIN